MNWHSIASFGLGFALTPAAIGLIGLFAYLGVAYKLDRALSAAGGATGIAVLLLVAAIGAIIIASRT